MSTSVIDPEAETKGFELEDLYAQPNWIIGNYSYTDARFSEEIADAFGNQGVLRIIQMHLLRCILSKRERPINGVHGKNS